MTCSALEGDGIEAVWSQVELHHATLLQSGELDQLRSDQQVRWMWSLVEARLLDALHSHQEIAELLPSLERSVRLNELPASTAADRVLDVFLD